MANFIAPLPSAFNHEAKDLSSEFRYWRQCFTYFCEINNITDGQTLIKLFRSCVGRITYLEDLPNNDQLTTVKLLLDIVENRYKKIVNVHARSSREIKFSIYRHKFLRKPTRLRKPSKWFQ